LARGDPTFITVKPWNRILGDELFAMSSRVDWRRATLPGMSTGRRLHYTYAQYLEALAMSELRLEYYEGDIFAMAGGTPEHGMLAAGLISLLSRQLPATCRVMTSDVKVRVLATGLSTFPDLSVVCGALERAPDDQNCITNPVLLVEVLSPSTEDYDRGEKLSQYKQIPSLQAVLLVAHDARRITLVKRSGDGWDVVDAREGETLSVATPPLTFEVREAFAPLSPPL
jgi:Uma2 family endonuclease